MPYVCENCDAATDRLHLADWTGHGYCATCADLAEAENWHPDRIVEPESLQWDLIMHRPTDAGDPNKPIPASAPRFCAFCGTPTHELEWSPVGWVCLGTADWIRDDILAEQQSFYPF